jgi:acetolactate synthase-1/2/3 large subunit
MSVTSIGFNTAGFAPKAARVMVNLDPHELEKSNYRPHLGIAADAGDFLREFSRQLAIEPLEIPLRWTEACAEWKRRYPTVAPDHLADPDHVNTYVFARALSEALEEEDVVVTGNSLDIVSVYQSYGVKRDQRVFTNINFGSMGWDLPAAVGACVARKGKRTCLITGDGTIQFNIQELMTIRANRLPVKIFIFNNGGYESIRSTQKNYFEGRLVGSDFGSGIGNPDFRHLALAYSFGYERVEKNSDLAAALPAVLRRDGPVLCELNVSPLQGRTPKTTTARRADGTLETRPLEDMFPFLPRSEVWENMHLFDDEDALIPA